MVNLVVYGQNHIQNQVGALIGNHENTGHPILFEILPILLDGMEVS